MIEKKKNLIINDSRNNNLTVRYYYRVRVNVIIMRGTTIFLFEIYFYIPSDAWECIGFITARGDLMFSLPVHPVQNNFFFCTGNTSRSGIQHYFGSSR